MSQATITRAHEGRHHIAYPYRLGNPAIFSQLVVGSQEVAVFRRHGSIVGALAAGQHSLSPTGAPFLTSLKSSDGNRYECDIMFVSIAPVRLGLEGPVGSLTDTSGRGAVFHMMGAFTVVGPDAMRVARDGIGIGEGGPGFDGTVRKMLMAGISKHLPGVLEGGFCDPKNLSSFGPALISAGMQDQLGIGVLGLHVQSIEVTRLVSAEGRAPAGMNAAAARAQLAADDSLPNFRSSRFGVTRVPFRDTVYNMTAHVSVVGYWEGDRVEGDEERRLVDAIRTTLMQAAATWQGTVLDLPGKRDEWGRYVTRVVGPDLQRRTQLRGRVIIEAAEIAQEEERELKRRRAAEMMG